MIATGVIPFLQANAGVAALVANRTYYAVLPRDFKLPALAVHRYGGTQDYQMNGPVQIREDQVQIDAYGRDAAEAEAVGEAVRAALAGFVGVWPDGTNVQACFLERHMDMPFLPNANAKSIADRVTLGFRVVTTR